MAQIINLNDAAPAAPASSVNVKWQKGAQTGIDPSTGLPIYPASANLPAATTSVLGSVKPDGVGIQVASDGAITKKMGFGFAITAALIGDLVTPPGRFAADRAGTVSKCKVVINASDPAVALTFRIRKNGTDVFSTDPTLAAGTAAGTVHDFAALTATPLAVAENDVFTIDVVGGSTLWNFTAELC